MALEAGPAIVNPARRGLSAATSARDAKVMSRTPDPTEATPAEGADRLAPDARAPAFELPAEEDALVAPTEEPKDTPPRLTLLPVAPVAESNSCTVSIRLEEPNWEFGAMPSVRRKKTELPGRLTPVICQLLV